MRTTLVIFFSVIILGAGAWYFLSAKVPAVPAPQLSVAVEESVVEELPPARCGQGEGIACSKYHNARYGFSLYHSERREVKEFEEGEGAKTIVFENLDLVRGFQIFVVPYAEPQISEERFKKDVPSGVRNNVTTMVVGGVEAVAFESTDRTLGDSYEVWFIRNGYLYEVTTIQSRAEALREILATWKFY